MGCCYWTIDGIEESCPSCGKTIVVDGQLHTGAGAPSLGHQCVVKVGDVVDLLDGTYRAITEIYCPDCCITKEHPDREVGSWCSFLEIIVENGIVRAGEHLPERWDSSQEKIEIKMGDIISPPKPRPGALPETPEDEYRFDATDEIRPALSSTAIISPFPIVSYDFLKQALLYYDKLVLMTDLSDKLDYGSKWTDYLQHNEALYSYIWENFRKRPSISRKRIFQHLHDRFNSEGVDHLEHSRELLFFHDAMSNFKDRVYEEFYCHINKLVDESMVVFHDPPRIQQQFLYKWLQKHYRLPENSGYLPYFANIVYGSHFKLPFAGDFQLPEISSRGVQEILEERLNKLTNREVIQGVVDSFATETLALNVPRLNARSFDDVLFARDSLNNELLAYRSMMKEFGQEIEKSWDWERLNKDSIQDLLQGKMSSAISDLNNKASERKRKFARDITFSTGKLAATLSISVHLGLPVWSKILIASGGLSIDVLKGLTELLHEKRKVSNESHLAYAWKLKKYL